MELIVKVNPEVFQSPLLPLKETRILPIGDIQYGSETDTERLIKYVEWGMKQKCYFIGMGDYIDIASPSNREVLLSIKPKLYDSTRKMIDAGIGGPLRELARILEPTKGRWLGMLKGHHWWTFGDGTDTTTRLAEFLDAPLGGDCAVYILPYTNGKKYIAAKIWTHHGAGSGMVASAPLTKLEHITKTFYADIYLMAHQHKKCVSVLPWIDFLIDSTGNARQFARNRYLVATGGFLKGYEQGTTDEMGNPAGTYVEQKMLIPTALGAPFIVIRPKLDEEPPRVDINVSV